MTQVRQNRNLFAHRMFDRTVPLPAHFGGELGEPLTMEELREQESEAVEVTDLVQSLYERRALALRSGRAATVSAPAGRERPLARARAGGRGRSSM